MCSPGKQIHLAQFIQCQGGEWRQLQVCKDLNVYFPLILRVYTSQTRVKPMKEAVGGRKRIGSFWEPEEKNFQTDGCEWASEAPSPN